MINTHMTDEDDNVDGDDRAPSSRVRPCQRRVSFAKSNDADDVMNIAKSSALSSSLTRPHPPQRALGRSSLVIINDNDGDVVCPSPAILPYDDDDGGESSSDSNPNGESTTKTNTTTTGTAQLASSVAHTCDDDAGEAGEKRGKEKDDDVDDIKPPMENVRRQGGSGDSHPRVSSVKSNAEDDMANATSERRVDDAVGGMRFVTTGDDPGIHHTASSASGGAMTFRGIQICLFLLELSIAVAIAASLFALLNILSHGSSWIFSTLAVGWIITMTLLFLQSLIDTSAYEGSNRGEGVMVEDEIDGLRLFESMHERRAQSKLGRENEVSCASIEDAVQAREPSSNNDPTTTREIPCPEKYLMNILVEERKTPPSTISFPLFAVLATVLLQAAARILVVVQNFRRSLPWRRRRLARRGLIRFSDIPLTIGRSMSTSGCSFRIFSFLNRLLESNVHDDIQHACSSVVHPDDSPISLNAISLDRISISTSHLVVNPKSQLSWFGIRLQGIDIGVTFLLKRQSRRVGEVSTSKDLQSVSLLLQVNVLEVGVFPFFFDWCRGSGIQLSARASFDADAFDSPGYGKHSTLSGFDLSGALSRVFTCRAPKVVQAKSRDRAFSWDKMHSTLHLRVQNEIESGCDGGYGRYSRRLIATSIKFPSGFILIHNSQEGNALIKSSPQLRRIHMNLRGQLSLAINMEHVASILSLLNETPRPLIKNFPATNKNASKGETKKKSSLHIVELKTVISMHLFTFVSKARLKDNRETLDFISLGTPTLSLYWRNHTESLPDSTGDYKQRDAKHPCDVPYSFLEANANDISLNRNVLCGDQLDCSIAENDLVRLNRLQVKTGVIFDHCHKSDEPKSTIIDLGGIFVRADGEDVQKLACTMKALEDTKLAAANLQSRVKEMTQAVSTKAENKERARDALSCIKLSCKHVDVIVELLELPGIVNDSDATGDEKVRVALLQMDTNVTILRSRDNNNEESCDLDYSNFDVNIPDQLFDIGVKKCAQHHLFDASVARIEGSVTFLPHLTLPVKYEASPGFDEKTTRGCSQEVTFYVKISKVSLKSAIPPKSRLNNERTFFISKVIKVAFDALKICERFSQRFEQGPSLLSIPVHEFFFQPDFFESEETGLPMAQTYALYAVADLVKILQCKGSFCMTEVMSVATGERTEIILVHFKRGLGELEVVWSPILQWLGVSCNNRIQRALACIRMPNSKKSPSKRTFISHKTNIRIGVDSNLRAYVHAYVGVKSYMCAVIEGGSTMNISTTKYSSSSTNTSPKETTNPNVFFEAKRIKVHFSDISTRPIFVIEGISLHNYLRSAHDNEIYEYSREKNSSVDSYDDELVRDHGGHPTKEIFELRVESSVKIQFPPAMHFGQIIEDMTLVPKALFDGLNRLKVDSKKWTRNYQLMSIKCTIPLLDISLMDIDPVSNQSAGTSILREEFRILFENSEVSIERNQPPSFLQGQINSLDEDDSSTHLYGQQIQGGFVRLAVKHVMCMIYPLSLDPLLRINDFSFNGYFYLAALSPTTPGIQAGKTVTSLLLCHHNHSTGNCLAAHKHRQCCCCYGVSLHSTGIPVKLYVDGRVMCGGFNLMFGSVLSVSIPRLMDRVQLLLPPKSEPEDGVAPKLTWWDSARFFIHGCISISADEVSFRWLLDSYTLWDRSIMFNCQQFEMRHSVGLFSVEMSNIYVSIPGSAYDMSVHPSVRDTNTEAESVVSREKHPLLYVPKLKAQIQISWEMLHPGGNCHKHHSVYMKNENREEMRKGDKFAPFRTGGVNVQLCIDLPGSDCIGADNWVALRVDVLPWFTHVSSSSKISCQTNEKDSNSFPTLRSVVVEACVKNMKMATWFENEEDVDGLCLIVKAVRYNASLDGEKEIVIEGPAKAALLDVSEFKHVVDAAGDIQERKQMVVPDKMKSAFGVGSWSNSEVNKNSTRPASCRGEDFESPLLLMLPFLKLQELSTNIGELDYVVVISQIDICNQSLAEILAVPSEIRRTNLQRRKSLTFSGIDRTTWSILVARCRLLWTIEIRDSIMGISNDLIYTIGFMNSQRRQLHVTNKENQEHITEGSCEVSSSFDHFQRDLNISRLEYLLGESFGAEQIHDVIVDETNRGKSTLPTLDVHFSNPQVQLHSIATGGSILLAMEQAQVEARKFIHFTVTNSRSKRKVSPTDLLRKTGRYLCDNCRPTHHCKDLLTFSFYHLVH